MNNWEFSSKAPFDVLSPITIGSNTDWELLKQQLLLDTILTGGIFARTYFGVFFDAGQGFPVRMNVTDFGKPEGHMKWPNDYPSLNSEIQGQFCGFDEHHQQLVVCCIGLNILLNSSCSGQDGILH